MIAPLLLGWLALAASASAPSAMPPSPAATAPEPRRQAAPKPGSNGDIQASSEQQSAPKADAKAAPKADSKTDSRAAAKPVPTAAPKADAKADPKADSKTDSRAAAKPVPTAAPKADAKADPKADSKVDSGAAAKGDPKTAPKADPELARAVERMQRFYEQTRDFSGRFEQHYTYKTFGHQTRAAGRVRFKKDGGSMRWDYEKPSEKVFLVARGELIAYDREAQQMVVSGLAADKLSASVTFLWGQGRLDREFDIARARRDDLATGIALELTPKKPDPRFQKIFFLLDPKTYAVRETLVVDPDGSENRMVFSEVKTNTGLGDDVFRFSPPKGTEILKQNSR